MKENQNEKSSPRDVYAFVTDRIIKELEKGQIPWQKPWLDAGAPRNLVTGRPYRGINVWLLLSLNFKHNLFLSFKQIKDLGASLKKNEKAISIVFWKWIEVKDEETGETATVPFLRFHSVFNIDQCDGLPEEVYIVEEQTKRNEPIKVCEEIVSGMPKRPEVRQKESKAYYHPLLDYVNMPALEKFKDSFHYYTTLFHELVHSTGHKSRLSRKGVMDQVKFGSEAYSFEELVAEIGACYLKGHAGFDAEHFENNTAYIKGWLEKLRGDKRFVIQAAALAQKATDFILNVQFEAIPEPQPQESVPTIAGPDMKDDLPF